MVTKEQGHRRFWKISPGASLARPDVRRRRTKHIHMSVAGGSERLITQMYLPGERNNASDPLVIMMGDAFARNIGQEYARRDSDMVLGSLFGIIADGRNATCFE